MSYHDIEVVKRWHIRCVECGDKFEDEAESAGAAEERAKNHIDGYYDETSTFIEGEYNHTVLITECTAVGRYVR